MLHVIVTNDKAVKRKAFYIGAATHTVNRKGKYTETFAIISYKNNNPDRLFSEVPLSSVGLDILQSTASVPFIENSVRKINNSLKKRK